MCFESSNQNNNPSQKGRHLKLWQISHHMHCLIIGTCLTLSDLNKLGRKLKLRYKPDFPRDYQLHAFFVTEAENPSPPTRLVNQLLDKKSTRYIQRIKTLKDKNLLENEWERALHEGNIAGPFWALVSYSETPPELSERAYADVHMLSHINGASRRFDIREKNKTQIELEYLKNRLNYATNKHYERMAEKNHEIELLSSLKDEKNHAPTSKETPYTYDNIEKLKHELQQAKQRLKLEKERSKETHNSLTQSNKFLNDSLHQLKKENLELKKELHAGELFSFSQNNNKTVQLDLKNQCILYVGGRPQSVSRYQEIIASFNGKLIYHDGGVERSINQLEKSITQADTVVFPCDCVSHSAVKKVKKLCRQNCKKFEPLRSSGLGSLLAVLSSESRNSYENEL
ncbi:MAG: hypothetical protein CFH06_00814 [Alphaproteobacteria bacterium MarineAlpha3_Bin5]|nr:hypothetical protein [Magnetovibrio sp.]PPR78417.1 MAG: hypothetical protein CFH06_00814 [Alphaproteobacteria bacterium MarineAlpha3_Bin5]